MNEKLSNKIRIKFGKNWTDLSKVMSIRNMPLRVDVDVLQCDLQKIK